MLDYYPEDSLHLVWVEKPISEVLQAIVNQKDYSHFRIASNEKTVTVNIPEFPEPERKH